MDLSPKTKNKLKSPPMITWLICFFFFIVPAVPIVLALISDSSQHQLGGFGIDVEPELTEEGKKLFKDKEFLIKIYLKAANQYQIPWKYLAAIHQVESDLSVTTAPRDDDDVTENTPIEQLKVGPMGFLERNWVGWGDDRNDFFATYPEARTPRSDDGDIKNSFRSIISNLSVIKKYKGVGVDGNGDGIADPYHIEDAIFSAANKLKKDGMKDGKIDDALRKYNRQADYHHQVKKRAQEIASYVRIPLQSEQVPTGSIKSMIDHAFELYRNRTIRYEWGGANYPVFDCSSWVQYMYKKHLGIQLNRTTYEQVKQGRHVPKEQLQPGDLVFFAKLDQYGNLDVYHVGMYVGNGQMIHNANSTDHMKLDSIVTGHYNNQYYTARRYTLADSAQ